MFPSRIFLVVSGILLCVNLAVAVDAPSKTKSGLQPGDTASAFHVQDVTGPRAGKTLCYACAFGKHTVVNIQTQKITDELIGILKELDGEVASAAKIKGDSQHAFLVYLTEDPDAAAEELAAVAKRLKLKNIPLTIYDELTGPKSYKLSTDAEVTVMMWHENKVAHNAAFAKGELDEKAAQAVLAAARKHLQASKTDSSTGK